MLRRFVLVGLISFFVATPSIYADDTLFEMTFTADKNEITIGEEITLSIDLLHGNDFKIAPLKKIDLKPFEIKKIASVPPKTANQATTVGYRIIVTIFELGEFKIPKFPIRFVDPQGKAGVVYTDEMNVTVLSVGFTEKDTGDIRPLKSQQNLDVTLSTEKIIKAVIVSILILIAFLIFLRWLMKRLNQWREDRKSPFEKAMDGLRGLEQNTLIETEQYKLYYTMLSEILKKFLTGQFSAGSLDQTTREYLSNIEHHDLLKSWHEDVSNILKQSDMAKFAKWLPPHEEAETCLKLARKIIENTIEEYLEQKIKIITSCPTHKKLLLV